ncbi:transketolase [Oceanibacterium hippocampi]|uniref:transketolase n=1 Tax=Oceanibacterium hippocampi TaxID=745714 RepID=UPI0035203F27
MADEITEQDMANAIRALAMDAVQKANSGHPGMPMGMADVATVLFNRFLKFDPAEPGWADRDRFVLSAGHGSMLLYSLLHLTGYEAVTLDQLRNFRQLGSLTPGHPEYGHTPGVETTTGPLGQGLTTAVGMALGERLLNARFGDLVDHRTYVIAGDGCLMEGISHEAISLAGHLRLGKLIVLWDDNEITIDGGTDLSVSDNQGDRFAAQGWHVQRVDGHDPEAIAVAIELAQASEEPSLIACRTVIGYGAPNKQGTSATHGAPLGDAEIAAARETLGWPYPPFEIPQPIRKLWLKAGRKGARARAAWEKALGEAPAATRTAFEAALSGKLPAAFAEQMAAYKAELAAKAPRVATRKASQMALEVINGAIVETVGGSADLTGSNNTKTSQTLPVTADDFSGRYIYYGVREHGMAAVMNGLALHGGVIPYGGTFLVFTDYARPAIRLSALMGLRVIYVMTHDSIGLGEDGPTHQPVEHLAALRAIPNLAVYRPADAMETAECWEAALQSDSMPSVIALSRQDLTAYRTEVPTENLCARGAYELRAADGDAKVTLIASGSEVELVCEARDRLQQAGIPTRVVSMPSWEAFERQSDAYRRDTLRPDTLRIAVEAATMLGWERYVGDTGVTIGMTAFGASAPYKELYNHFGLTVEAIVEAAKSRLG